MKKRKHAWIVYGQKVRSGSFGYSYEHLTLTFKLATVRDAADDVRDAAINGQEMEYYASRCRAIRDATGGSTRYYSARWNVAFTLKFQRNTDGKDSASHTWYGCRLDGADRVNSETVAGLARLAKVHSDNPADFIAALRAIPVRYGADPDAYIDADPIDVSDVPTDSAAATG